MRSMTRFRSGHKTPRSLLRGVRSSQTRGALVLRQLHVADGVRLGAEQGRGRKQQADADRDNRAQGPDRFDEHLVFEPDGSTPGFSLFDQYTPGLARRMIPAFTYIGAARLLFNGQAFGAGRTLPPLWGKGRVGGVRACSDELSRAGAGAQSCASPHPSGHTSTQPSSIEEEGFDPLTPAASGALNRANKKNTWEERPWTGPMIW